MNSEKERDELTEPNIPICVDSSRDELFCIEISSLTLCSAGQLHRACCTTSLILHVKKAAMTKPFTSQPGKKRPGVNKEVNHPAASRCGCCHPVQTDEDNQTEPLLAVMAPRSLCERGRGE